MKLLRKFQNDTASGYTLLEVVIGLFLFVAVVVPLMAGLFSNTGTLRTEESLIATWLLEQEAASVRLFTDEGLTSKRRLVDGIEWTIKIKAEGSPLTKYTLSAFKHGKKREEVIVYGIRTK
jgi:hypothetical protein